MKDDVWRTRLEAAFKKSDRSARSVSLASGNTPGYLHSLLVEGKEPKIGNLISVCEALGVSAAYVIHGFEVTPEQEEFLALVADNPEKLDAIKSLLSSRKSF